jgi:hypothetical protein
VALTVFVFKENRDVTATTAGRQHQISELQPSAQSLGYVVEQLAKYSADKPELKAILTKHGIRLNPTPPDSQSMPPLH